MQHAGGRNHHIRHVFAAGGGANLPAPVLELAVGDGFVEVDLRGHAVFIRYPLEVGANLRAGGEGLRPVGIGLEGIGVEMRRHVAGDAGIGVLAPGAANAVGFLVDGVVGVTRLPQLDGGENAGHAGADDDDARIAVIVLRSAHCGTPRRALPSGQPCCCMNNDPSLTRFPLAAEASRGGALFPFAPECMTIRHPRPRPNA